MYEGRLAEYAYSHDAAGHFMYFIDTVKFFCIKRGIFFYKVADIRILFIRIRKVSHSVFFFQCIEFFYALPC